MREVGDLNRQDFRVACADCGWSGLFYDMEAHAGNCPGRAPLEPPCPTPDMRAKADRLLIDAIDRPTPSRWVPVFKLLILITEELWGPSEKVKVNDD